MDSLNLTVEPITSPVDPIQAARKLREMANAFMGDLDMGETHEEVIRAAEQAVDMLGLETLPVPVLRSIASAAHRDSSIRSKGALIKALRGIVLDPLYLAVVGKGG